MIKDSYKYIQLGLKFKKYKSTKDEVEKERVAEYISRLLSAEGGLLLKVGQYLGTGSEESNQIKKLSFRKNQLDFSIIKEELKRNLGSELYADIEKLEEEGASASIGQVHIASITDEKVAIKIQYPNIERKLKKQLKVLNLIPTDKPAKKFGINIEAYQKMIEKKILSELDYKLEAKNTEKIGKLLKDSSIIKIPKVYSKYSNERVLVTEYLDGCTLNEVLVKDFQQKKKYGENLLLCFLDLLKAGITQADSNHGNFIFIEEDNKIGLIDFGQCLEIEEKRIIAFYYLIFNMQKRKKISYLSVLGDLGFDPKKLNLISDKLHLICGILFEPFLLNKNYDLSQWNYKKKLERALGENKWLIRSAGDQDLFLLMKSFMGFKNLIQQIGIAVNWYQLFLESTSTMRMKIESYRPRIIENENHIHELNSNWINIEIFENESLNISFKLPITEIFDLENQLSEETKKELISQKIIVGDIIDQAIANGAKPQTIFKLNQGVKTFHIYLS